ncbi:hypothetical protein HMI55_000192 [Coelomomyces lativittatus]|nr:hypothetical protein HMI55_000192 [Coelomomyces lativittatus]
MPSSSDLLLKCEWTNCEYEFTDLDFLVQHLHTEHVKNKKAGEYLFPVVSGNLLLPSIQFYPDLSTSSLPQRSISFQTSIQSLSNWFKSGQTTGSSSTFSVTKIGSQSHSLTIQPELVWTVVVVGNNVIGVQKKNMSTQSLPSELKLGSTLDLRRTSHFSPVVV